MKAEKMNPEKRLDAFEALVKASSGKERALALLREQRCESNWEKDMQLVLTKLVESDLTIDLVGTISDEVGQLIMYIINKQALLSEFCGGVFSYIVVNRISGVDQALALYMAHKLERAGTFLEEELELGYERIIHSLLVSEDQSFRENTKD